MLVDAYYFNPPFSERIMLTALMYSERRVMTESNLLLGIAGIITALGGLLTVCIKYHRGKSEIHDLKVQRNTELENYLFGRFKGELDRMDERLKHCEERHDKCEENYRAALREIEELKKARAQRAEELAVLRSKIDAIELMTNGSYPKLKE